MSNIPRVKGSHWFLGNVKDFREDMWRFILDSHTQYGDVLNFQWTVLFRLFFSTINNKHIKHILIDNSKNYRKGLSYRMLKPLLGEGLLTSEGEFWLRQRRLSQPAFSKNKLTKYAETIHNTIAETVNRWEISYTDGSINISKEMHKIALSVVTRTLFMSNVSNVNGAEETFRKKIQSIMERMIVRVHRAIPIPFWLPIRSHRLENRDIKEVLSLVDFIIASRRKEKNSTERHDLLKMLMTAKDADTGEQMNDKQLRDEIVTLFIAGFETTSLTLSYTILLLAMHPNCQKKLSDEINTFVNKDDAVSFDLLQKLHYLDAIVKESQRLFPPAWQISRRSLSTDKFPDGYAIPKHAGIMIPIFALHRNPKYWERSEEFDPERWLRNGEPIEAEPFTYMPFGAGQRICIGERFALLEIKLALIFILQRYSLKPIAKEKIEVDTLITLKPKNEIIIDTSPVT